MDSSTLFGPEQSDSLIVKMLKKGAEILDVRTEGEFQMASAKGSRNIPLDRLYAHIDELRNSKKSYVVVCRSGNRSGWAASEMRTHGIDAVNGGPWQNVVT